MSLGDGVIRRIDSSGNILKSFDRPGNVSGGDPKFAFDGIDLWMSDISSLTVIGTDGSQKSYVEISFDTDSQPINGITDMNGAIWTTAPDSKLRRINAQAKAQETKALPVNAAGAAAFDGESLWVAEGFTGNNSVTHLYQVNSNLRVTAVYTLSGTVAAGTMLLMADHGV
jgi:sugar lactone lactonase YvrE